MLEERPVGLVHTMDFFDSIMFITVLPFIVMIDFICDKGQAMLKVFNAFQITALFAAAPYGIQWLSTAEFPAHQAAFWLSVVAYFVFFVIMTGCTFTAIEKS